MGTTTSSIRRSSVTVVPLNKVLTLHEIDENQVGSNNPTFDTSPIDGSRSPRPGMIHQRRSSLVVSSRPRALSFDHVYATRPRLGSIQIQLTDILSQLVSVVANSTSNRDDGVVVTHVSRQNILAQSHLA